MRQPHHLFDPEYYRKNCPAFDKRKDPLLHFMQIGDVEGRRPHPLFDPQFYRDSNPGEAIVAPFAHYSEIGARRLRTPCPAFDPLHYVALNPAAAESGMDPLLHYLLSAARHCHPLIDNAYQRATARPMQKPKDALVDYILFRSADARALTSTSHRLRRPPRALLADRENGRCSVTRENPKVAVIIHCPDDRHEYLQSSVDGLALQTYRDWGLVMLHQAANIRINHPLSSRMTEIATQGADGFVQQLNLTISTSDAEYIVLLKANQRIVPSSVGRLVHEMLRQNGDMAYADETFRECRENIDRALIKPAWSPILFYHVDYIGSFFLARRSMLLDLGLFRKEYESNCITDMVLRANERARRILHVPCILSHDHDLTPNSVRATRQDNQKWTSRRIDALNEHFRRSGWMAEARVGNTNDRRINLRPIGHDAAVAIEIDVIVRATGKDSSSEFARSLFSGTPFKVCSVVTVGSSECLTHVLRRGCGAYVLFLECNIRYATPGLLATLIMYAQRADAAFVAPRLSSRDGVGGSRLAIDSRLAIQKNVGLIPVDELLALDASVATPWADCDQEVSAVRGECALVRRSILREIGLHKNFATLSYAIADASFRAGEVGLKNVSIASGHVGFGRRSPEDDLRLIIDRQILFDRHEKTFAENDRYFRLG